MTQTTHPSLPGTETARSTASAAPAPPGQGCPAMHALRVVVSSERPLHEMVRQFKRDFIAMTLQATQGNRSEAARRLGIQRTYLHRLIRELEIQVAPGRGRPDRSAPRGETP